MKPVFKYALASLALAASSGAFAAVTTPDTGNGSLVLFVRDLSSPSRVFAADLGVTLDSLLTQDAITNTPGNTTDLRNGTPISVNAALPSFHSDALATFLQTSSALGYEYAILGGDTLGSSSVSDAFRYVGTNEVQFGTSFLSNTTTNQLNDNSGIASTVNGFFADLNGALGANSFVTNFAEFGQAGTFGAQANTFFGTPFDDDTATVGTATNLYMLTSSGSSSAKARIYQFADVTLSFDGTLTSASVGGPQVPLPAAVWLLGSALVGLGTIRRRRNGEVAAA
jgi:hypothetical protein